MTGRELIVYILENHLEDKPVFENGKFVGFLTVEEAAAKMNLGVATINAFIQEGWLEGNKIGDNIYTPANLNASIPKKSV